MGERESKKKTGLLKIFSTNINGLNSPSKRKKTFKRLEKLSAEIICLQETHIKLSDSHLLEQKKLGKLFIAADKLKKKRGVAMYIKEQLNPQLRFAAEDGRFLAVEIQRGNKKTLIINLYAPNDSQEFFYGELTEELRKQECQDLIILGDYNTVFDRKIDKTGGEKRKSGNLLPRVFLKWAKEQHLLDVWRTRFPKILEYTYYSHRHKSWSRIDMG